MFVGEIWSTLNVLLAELIIHIQRTDDTKPQWPISSGASRTPIAASHSTSQPTTTIPVESTEETTARRWQRRICRNTDKTSSFHGQKQTSTQETTCVCVCVYRAFYYANISATKQNIIQKVSYFLKPTGTLVNNGSSYM